MMDKRTEMWIWIMAVLVCLIGIAVMMPVNTGCTWWGR